MARRAVVDKDLGYKQIQDEIQKMQKKYVVIGFQESTVTKYQVKGDRIQEAGASVAQYAAYNEFGTDTIPARSFMRTAFDENSKQIQQFIRIQTGKIIDGLSTVDKSLGLIGQAIQGLIQRKITEIKIPPNSPITIKLKGSSKPLIDFGQMLSSVTYAIRSVR